MQNSIEEDIKILKSIIKINNDYLKGVENQTINQKEIKALEHILQDYKRVLKENERISSENGIGKRQYEELVDDYEKLNLENIELKKENEELKSKLENKDKYFELITGLGYDYDGYYNRETSNGNIKDLADLIDELVQAARDGLNDMPYQK